jgi:hypothetical protein
MIGITISAKFHIVYILKMANSINSVISIKEHKGKQRQNEMANRKIVYPMAIIFQILLHCC